MKNNNRKQQKKVIDSDKPISLDLSINVPCASKHKIMIPLDVFEDILVEWAKIPTQTIVKNTAIALTHLSNEYFTSPDGEKKLMIKYKAILVKQLQSIIVVENYESELESFDEDKQVNQIVHDQTFG